MEKPKLTYFDTPSSRGEDCRLALHLAGVDFEDVRVKTADWPALKAGAPFGQLPYLELPGKPTLAQSNAILTYVGREHGLHPTDNFEAARHEAMMDHLEDLRETLGPTTRMEEAEKKSAREKLAVDYLPTWAAQAERQFGDGPFFGGAKINVVDLKIYMVVRWLKSGRLDHIPATIFASYKKLVAAHDAVRDHAAIQAWNAKH